MEAHISSFVFCDTIQVQLTEQGPRYQIVSPLQALTPIAIPGNFSFSISCSILGFDENTEHELSIYFSSPDDTVIAKPIDRLIFTPNTISKGISSLKIPSVTFNIDLRNIVLNQEGTYKASVLFDQKSIGEYPIEVLMIHK